MLAFVERYFDIIRQSHSDADIIDILNNVAADFDFRSAYLIEYSDDLSSALHVLDSNPDRSGWWEEYIAQGLRTNSKDIAEILSRGGVQPFDGTRFTDPDDPLLAFARKSDMVECTLVPISHSGKLVGLGGFSGLPELNPQQHMALQLLVYALFAQVRTFSTVGIVTRVETLTPREKQVISLSAEGLTSTEIATSLGMSARTVNQHVDNVATKLGTKNRPHTVAEAIRHHLL